MNRLVECCKKLVDTVTSLFVISNLNHPNLLPGISFAEQYDANCTRGNIATTIDSETAAGLTMYGFQFESTP